MRKSTIELADFLTFVREKMWRILQGEYQYPIEHPYILKTLSNLLDAQRILAAGKRSDFSAFFVDGGEIHEAVDSENSLIRNELIDGASDKINGFADDLMYLEREGKK